MFRFALIMVNIAISICALRTIIIKSHECLDDIDRQFQKDDNDNKKGKS